MDRGLPAHGFESGAMEEGPQQRMADQRLVCYREWFAGNQARGAADK